MTMTLMVAIGGMAGCVARFWLSGWAQRFTSGPFPIGTLSVNLLGSFVIGVIAMLVLDRDVVSGHLRVLLIAGFCGGFTTMSAFSFETVILLRDGHAAMALANAAATVIGCTAATWLGMAVGRAA